MGGRHFGQRSSSSTSISRTNRAIIAFICVIILITLYFFSSFNQKNVNFVSSNSEFIKIRPQNSFVKSLDEFLKTRAPKEKSADKNFPSVDGNLTLAAANRLDDAIWRRETLELTENRDGPFPVRVYVYDMPSKFTYDLLWLFHNTYRETANLTSNGSPVHRLVEQHSVDYWLWADLIAPENERVLRSVVRVHRQEEADLFYIPFFTTISFFLMEKAQCKQLYRVWERFQGSLKMDNKPTSMATL